MALVTATHRVPDHDVIDHEATAPGPNWLVQCVCGPTWRQSGFPFRWLATHHPLALPE